VVNFYRIPLLLFSAAIIAAGIWIMVSGNGDGFGFPFDLPEWMLMAGKEMAVGSIVLLAGLVVIVVALALRPSKQEAENDQGPVGPLDSGT
jgi:hypothetical protein